MRQNDDLLHSYTVAKITMDCDFNPITQKQYVVDENGGLDDNGYFKWKETGTEEPAYEVREITHDGVVFKIALVAVTYHCG